MLAFVLVTEIVSLVSLTTSSSTGNVIGIQRWSTNIWNRNAAVILLQQQCHSFPHCDVLHSSQFSPCSAFKA